MKKKPIMLLIGLIVVFLFSTGRLMYGEEINTESYHVHMQVRDNRSFDISERIQMYFNSPMHGISRYIPKEETKGSILPDGNIELKESLSSVKINQIKVERSSYNVKNKLDHKVIVIGDEGESLLGQQEYKINYTWNPGKNHDIDGDQVTYEIIPKKWNRSIGSVSFEIDLPKKFSEEEIYFKFGAPTSSIVQYRVEGNKVIGVVDGGLSSNTGLTFYLRLPKGYFNNEVTGTRYNLLILSLLIIVFYCATRVSVKFTLGKKIRAIPTNLPPSNLAPAELTYIKQGKLTYRNVVVTILDFAVRGCVRYEQRGEKEFTLYKIRDVHPLSPGFEKIFMSALFEGGKTQVSSSDLFNNFYIRLINTQRAAEREINKQGFMMSRKVESSRLILTSLLFLSTFLTSLILHLKTSNFLSIGELLMNIVIGIVIFIPLYCTVSNIRKKNQQNRVQFELKKWLLGIFSSLLILMMVITGLLNQENNWLFFIALLEVIYIMYLSGKATKLSEEAYQIRCEILGFQLFLSSIDKQELIYLIKKNKQYCYDMLPYAQALGVTKDYLTALNVDNFEFNGWQFLTKDGVSYQPKDYSVSLSQSISLLTKILTSSNNDSASSGGWSSDYYSDNGSWSGGDTSSSSGDGGGGAW